MLSFMRRDSDWSETEQLCFVQFLTLLSELGTHRLTEVVSHNVDRFSPLFVGDHMVAM